MSSYRTQAAVRPTRNPLGSGIPHDRRQHWTELPGWITSYVREKTEIARKEAQNAHVYDILCKLWKVSESFGATSEEDRQVFIISEAITSRDPDSLTRDVLHAVEFLAKNTSSNTKRLAWIDPNLHREFRRSTSNDWIVLPVSDMLHWLSHRVPKTTEKLLRHIPKSIPCQVAVFGNLNHSAKNPLSAAAMRFSQVWHRGIFLTITSGAAASNPDGLKKLISKLIKRQYDDLENSSGSTDKAQIVLWLSLHTYWLLSPPSISEGRTPENISIPGIRAFNELHNPDLPVVPVLNKDQVDKGIKCAVNEGTRAIHLMESEEIIRRVKIPRAELNHHVRTMVNLHGDRSVDNEHEVNSIIGIGIDLIRNFWLFKINLVVVDNLELNQLDQNELPWVHEEQFFRMIQWTCHWWCSKLVENPQVNPDPARIVSQTKLENKYNSGFMIAL